MSGKKKPKCQPRPEVKSYFQLREVIAEYPVGGMLEAVVGPGGLHSLSSDSVGTQALIDYFNNRQKDAVAAAVAEAERRGVVRGKIEALEPLREALGPIIRSVVAEFERY